MHTVYVWDRDCGCWVPDACDCAVGREHYEGLTRA